MNRGIIAFAFFCCTVAAARAQYGYNLPPDVAATAPSSEYPVHIHILNVHWNHTNGGYQGYGRADLLGPTPTGVDYTFSCTQPFLHNVAKAEFYQGKWKKQDQKLEILMQQVGSDHIHKCELKTMVKTEPYGKYGEQTPTPAAAAKPVAPPPQ